MADSVRVGAPDDKLIPERAPENILLDSRGTVSLTFNGWTNRPILRYDSAGRFIGRLGASGRGPGEYVNSSFTWLGPGDSTYVLAEGRIQAFGPDGSYGGSTNFTKASVHFLGMTPNGHFIAESGRFRDTVSKPHVLRFDRQGTLIDSLPIYYALHRVKMSYSPDQPLVERLMPYSSKPALSDDGTVWTTYGLSYRLEKHDSAGRPVRLFGMQLPGAHQPQMGVAGVDTAHASPYSFAKTEKRSNLRFRPSEKVTIQPSGDTLVWVIRHVAAPSWDTITVRIDLRGGDEAPGEDTMGRDVEDRLYHSIIDVVDARSGALLARHELPFQALPVRPGYVARVTQDDDGFFVTRVYALRFTRR